jgi:FkbH-like protein
MHCRRFEYGIQTIVVDDADYSGRLMRLRFRQWAKLEGRGPTPLRSRRTAALTERLDTAASLVIDGTPLGSRVRTGLSHRWNVAKTRKPSGVPIRAADAFVVECLLLETRPLALTLTIVPPGEAGFYQRRIDLIPDYSLHVIPVADIQERVDLTRPFLISLEPAEPAIGRELILGLVDFVFFKPEARGTFLNPLRSKQAPEVAKSKAKCVVWDLDDTVWEGTLVEDGIEGVKLKQEVVDVIKTLDARGILHSIASKNDHYEALKALDHFGISEYFLHPQIGWDPKSSSIDVIAKMLDIGLDTFVFIDDQAFERAEVGERYPELIVFPHTAIASLCDHPLFDVPVTAESARRRLMYREELCRKAAYAKTDVRDFDEFLRSCEIVVEATRLNAASLQRVFELSQRTNQLNIAGTRYDLDALTRMMAENSGWLPLVLSCRDRFGDYGIIGFVNVDLDESWIHDFFMSCRVQRKQVEHAVFEFLFAYLRARRRCRVAVRYRKTARNSPAVRLLEELGFEMHETEPGQGFLERDLGPVRNADIVTVVNHTGMYQGRAA